MTPTPPQTALAPASPGTDTSPKRSFERRSMDWMFSDAELERQRREQTRREL